jgi:hypothetical protein
MFKAKTEKIYKFVYETGEGYHSTKKTFLLTAHTPVQAVKMFNRMAGNKLVNIIEFVEVVPKTEETG